MEPMLLGSPTSPVANPSNAALHGNFSNTPTSTTSAPYLPSYLLGENHHSAVNTGVRVPVGGLSPGSSGSGSRLFGTPGQQSSPASPLTSNKDAGTNFNTPKFGGGRLGERHSGPPVQGLGSPATPLHTRSPFPDHTRAVSAARTPMGSSPHSSLTVMRGLATPQAAVTPSSTALNTSLAIHREHLNASIISTEVHSDVTSSADLLTNEWVTVFGFPVASSSYILTQFAQLGTIIDQRMAGSGNWMHLKFQTPLQARKALTLNSKIFGNNIMVGVVPCTDRSLVNENKENRNVGNSSSVPPYGTPVTVGAGGGLNNTSLIGVGARDSSFSTPKANIRSLTQAYHTTPSDNQVLSANNTPKKNDSFISKAMQHILGV